MFRTPKVLGDWGHETVAFHRQAFGPMIINLRLDIGMETRG